MTETPPHGLQFFPVPLFASVMGVGGLSLAWRRAATVYDVPTGVATALFWVALTMFAVLVVAYAAKWLRYPAAAWAEAKHPIRMAFVPTITIATLIIATAGQTIMPDVARVLWWVGALGHVALTVAILTAWFEREDIGLTQMTPAWFIPIVGNVVTPLAAHKIGSVEFAWFAFGIGLIFWMALLPLLLFRLLLHENPMPPKLLPSLAIFVAPPSVALLSWVALTGEAPSTPPTRILYGCVLVFVALVAGQYPKLRKVPFAIPYWAFTFPAAAAAAAATTMAGALAARAYDVVAIALLAVASVIVAGVFALTLRAAVRGQICVPE